MSKCSICKRTLNQDEIFSADCGGDCRLCVAVSGDTQEAKEILDKLSATAFAMKLRTGKRLGHCYEAIAVEQGFKTYTAMRAALKGV